MQQRGSTSWVSIHLEPQLVPPLCCNCCSPHHPCCPLLLVVLGRSGGCCGDAATGMNISRPKGPKQWYKTLFQLGLKDGHGGREQLQYQSQGVRYRQDPEYQVRHLPAMAPARDPAFPGVKRTSPINRTCNQVWGYNMMQKKNEPLKGTCNEHQAILMSPKMAIKHPPFRKWLAHRQVTACHKTLQVFSTDVMHRVFKLHTTLSINKLQRVRDYNTPA